MNIQISVNLVRRLVSTQFPEWKDLLIQPVASGGWDNRIFRLGDQMLVRLPSAAQYANQAEKEHQWLPKLVHRFIKILPLELRESSRD